MNNQARQILLTLRGKELTRPLIKGTLADLCPQCRSELSALLAAYDQGIALELGGSAPSGAPSLWLARLVKRLEEDGNLNHEAARWAVESFALFHGMTDVSLSSPLPISPPPLPTSPPPLPVSADANNLNERMERADKKRTIKSSTMLRWCLVLEWVFGLVLYVVASVALNPSLPEPLGAWIKAQNDRNLPTGTLVFDAIFLLSWIISSVGLFCLRRWAAWLYLITFVFGTTLSLFTDPSVDHAIARVFSDIGSVMSGMVIALAFFTDSLTKQPNSDVVDRQGKLHADQ
jgi:4-amino-4-deoxy-L-arabinose transferase-like glycosyltransferase